MKHTLKITPVRHNEIEALRAISEETFIDTFASQNEPENIAAYVANAFTFDRLHSEHKNPDSDFRFARLGAEIAGYLKLNTGLAQTEQDLPNAMEIERIYALPSFHGKGVGKALMGFALDQAAKANAEWVWLGVWERNEHAIAFYEHHGFEKFGRHDFMMGNERQYDVMMRLQIGSN